MNYTILIIEASISKVNPTPAFVVTPASLPKQFKDVAVDKLKYPTQFIS